MKTLQKIDFSINVRPQELEENPSFSEFYRGIYSVTLNKLVDITFVPEFERMESNWPPALPDNVDEPSSLQEARLWTIGLSKYVVTPSLIRAGQEEVISLPDSSNEFNLEENSPDNGVIFYVTPQEFDGFSQELSEVSKQTLPVYSYVKFSEVQSLLTFQFLLRTIVNSENFSASDLNILKR
jgi:hypothetical protein